MKKVWRGEVGIFLFILTMNLGKYNETKILQSGKRYE